MESIRREPGKSSFEFESLGRTIRSNSVLIHQSPRYNRGYLRESHVKSLSDYYSSYICTGVDKLISDVGIKCCDIIRSVATSNSGVGRDVMRTSVHPGSDGMFSVSCLYLPDAYKSFQFSDSCEVMPATYSPCIITPNIVVPPSTLAGSPIHIGNDAYSIVIDGGIANRHNTFYFGSAKNNIYW